MKKKWITAILTAILILSALVPLCVISAAGNIRFVTAGGTGDGKTAASAMGDLADAIEELATDGGTIVIVGSYDLTTSSAFSNNKRFSEPAHSGAVTITGSYDGVNYNGEIHAKNGNYYCLSGSTMFENLTFRFDGEATNATFLFSARFNPITIGENFDISSFAGGAFIVGGYNNGDPAAVPGGTETRNVSITIKSGSFRYVVGLDRYLSGKTYANTIEIQISNATVTALIAGIHGTVAQKGGDCTITLGEKAHIENLYSVGDWSKLNALEGLESLTVRVVNKDIVFSKAYIGSQVKDKASLKYIQDAAAAVAAIQSSFGSTAVIPESPVVTTEPPVVTTEPPVVTTEPPVVTTEPPVVTTEPPVVTTEPPVTSEAPATTAVPETTNAPASTQASDSSSPSTGDITGILFGAAAFCAVLILLLLRRKKEA